MEDVFYQLRKDYTQNFDSLHACINRCDLELTNKYDHINATAVNILLLFYSILQTGLVLLAWLSYAEYLFVDKLNFTTLRTKIHSEESNSIHPRKTCILNF